MLCHKTTFLSFIRYFNGARYNIATRNVIRTTRQVYHTPLQNARSYTKKDTLPPFAECDGLTTVCD